MNAVLELEGHRVIRQHHPNCPGIPFPVRAARPYGAPYWVEGKAWQAFHCPHPGCLGVVSLDLDVVLGRILAVAA